MKLIYFVFAGIFLFHPIISTFDLLPDFIAYFLMMHALSEASYVYDNASDAHTAMKHMTVVSLCRFACSMIFLGADETMALVISFAFGILEIMYGVSALVKLFDFMSYIAMQCGEFECSRVSEKFKKFTVVFFISKVVASSIPDFFALFLIDEKTAWMYRFRTLLFVIFSFAILVIGVIWLVKFIKFFKSILTKEIREKIKENFSSKMENRQGIFFSKDFIFAISIIGTSSFLLIDFNLGYINVLPDLLFSVACLGAFFFLIKKRHILIGKLEILLFSTFGFHIISSTLNTVYSYDYFNEYALMQALKNYNATEKYITVCIISLIESLLLLMVCFLVLILMKKYAVKGISENSKLFTEYTADGYISDFSKAYNKKMVISLVLSFIMCTASALFGFMRLYYSEGFIVVVVVTAIAFIISFIHTLSYVKENVYSVIFKYS